MGTFVQRFEDLCRYPQEAASWAERPRAARLSSLSVARSRRSPARDASASSAGGAPPDAHRAAARRQGACRLERHDDRGLRQCRAPRNPAWTAVAARAFDFVVKAMGDGDRLAHSWRDGKRGHWASPTTTRTWRAPRSCCGRPPATSGSSTRQTLVHVLDEFFWDAKIAAVLSATDDAPMLHRVRTIIDRPRPAPMQQ